MNPRPDTLTGRTPDDFTDDRVIDALFCNDCTED